MQQRRFWWVWTYAPTRKRTCCSYTQSGRARPQLVPLAPQDTSVEIKLRSSRLERLFSLVQGVPCTKISTTRDRYNTQETVSEWCNQLSMTCSLIYQELGFTKNLNPLISSVICSEAIEEANMSEKPYLVTFDTKKAFDIVNHVFLRKNIYEEGLKMDLWNIVDQFYTGMTSNVK